MTTFDYRTINQDEITDKVILGIINELETYVYVNLTRTDIDDIAKNIGSKAKKRGDKEQDILAHKINGRVSTYLQSEDKSNWYKRYDNIEGE